MPSVAPYGPTPLYGECEELDCQAQARTTCESCDGEYCRTHTEHPHTQHG